MCEEVTNQNDIASFQDLSLHTATVSVAEKDCDEDLVTELTGFPFTGPSLTVGVGLGLDLGGGGSDGAFRCRGG